MEGRETVRREGAGKVSSSLVRFDHLPADQISSRGLLRPTETHLKSVQNVSKYVSDVCSSRTTFLLPAGRPSPSALSLFRVSSVVRLTCTEGVQTANASDEVDVALRFPIASPSEIMDVDPQDLDNQGDQPSRQGRLLCFPLFGFSLPALTDFDP